MKMEALHFLMIIGQTLASIHCLPSFGAPHGLPNAFAGGGSSTAKSDAFKARRARLCSAFLKALSLSFVVIPQMDVLRYERDISSLQSEVDIIAVATDPYELSRRQQHECGSPVARDNDWTILGQL